MKRRADPPVPAPADRGEERAKLIGLGKRSISKSYYPELRARLEELERFRGLLDQVSDAIFVVDAVSGLVLDASGAVKAMLGCAAGELKGIEFAKLLPEHIARYAANLFNHKNEVLQLETEFHHPVCGDAPAVPVEMSLRLVEQQGDRCAVIVARDISERRRNEEALRKSHDELEIRVRERTRELDRANRAKSEFLSIVSHELRTPLTSVLGFAKITRKKLAETVFPAVESCGDEKVRREMIRAGRNLDIIVSEGERLTALINDVLDLAKLEANRIDYRMERLRPGEFIERSMEASDAMFEEAGLAFLAEVADDLPRVRGDRDRLIQVLVNLFSNAAKFTDKGSVTCRAERAGGYVKISVADTGTGIPQPLLGAIFDKFVQGEGSLADRPRGTGLGLPICRHIIEGHGGHIWAESGEGAGSRFVFTLPALRE
ncbi:PAS domain-containing sensor histidine kinase [Pseudodesulfovibrio sp.]|uniref:PAS domain-containing sensor histidine kinase n=1 Tax=Pseudodesulfovibrio sp. TaxID=2035812 RepID=UPI00260F2C03|nr:PAS domain-containing sensor histidine kinase [Pseudodesulfovibrio sp.]MDD3310535.1 PAS domain-containing sensor histidine kinase [Pseudodesulfovibrio sp.]